MKHQDPVVIVGIARTPLGSFLGSLSSLSAPDLGAVAIKAAIARAKIPAQDVDEVIMGCVVSAGQGQAPARQAAIFAELPTSVGATTINKVCGSGMKSVMLAHDSLIAGTSKIIVAGGMESMSNAPYLLERARTGHRLGHTYSKDSLMLDGLEDAHDKGVAMGAIAEGTAEKYNLTREMQDEFALLSLQRALTARDNGWFLSDYEITPIEVKSIKGEAKIIKTDEPLDYAKPEKIPLLKPVFKANGTITAANASSIADGAAAMVLMRLSEAKKRNIKPIAKILAASSFALDPALFAMAPIEALRNILQDLHWSSNDVDLFEINEAFACVPMAAMHELNLSIDKVNVHGGACALGHPIGASGARIICTLLGALKQRNKTRGIATLCIGGGEATALAIEMCYDTSI